MSSISSSRTVVVACALVLLSVGAAGAQELDALFLGGYWCNSDSDTKTESIPRNRTFLLSREVGGDKERAYTERLIDIANDVRGQKIILAQRLKNSDGSKCKNNCLIAERIVHRDLLEIGDWNSSMGVFKSNSPREYLYRCEK